jgi:hypothetical protein
MTIDFKTRHSDGELNGISFVARRLLAKMATWNPTLNVVSSIKIESHTVRPFFFHLLKDEVPLNASLDAIAELIDRDFIRVKSVNGSALRSVLSDVVSEIELLQGGA